ncbi:MAG: transcriptional regulator, AraC family [Gammaproteobacteria bacterium]|nr:transcriptional regulator, AraC family [Gammaproteobacteria bacterium]
MAVKRSEHPLRIAFFLVPQFSMMSFAAAIEPLRSANRAAGWPLFEWLLASAQGEPVVASNGIPVAVSGPLHQIDKLDMVIVCAGLEIPAYPGIYPQLRRLSRHGVLVGAISSGPFILAEAGLLNDRRCTVHWEYTEALRAKYPQLQVTQELYVIDRDVFTCSGGTAALDMMLHFVTQVAGAELARGVAEQFIHAQIRKQEDHQRLELHARHGIDHPKLVQAIGLMEAALDEPLDVAEIASRTRISTRQIERLFREHLGSSPKAFYLGLRAAKARTLLQHTLSPLRTIALECGFESTSHFSHAYKRVYGIPPTHERRSRASGAVRQPATAAATPCIKVHGALQG